MGHATDTFRTADGLTLWRQWWLPDGEPRAVVLLLHGLGEHSGRYEHVAAALVHNGYAVHAVDHRGHGRSEGARAFVRSYDEFMGDVAAFRRLVEAQHPSVPLVVLGHSMGANLAVGHVLDHQEGVAVLALSGAALAPGASLKPVMIKAAKVLGRLVPKLRPDKLDAEAISRDPAVVARYRNDRLVYTGRLSAGVAGALLSAMERFPARYGELRVPILILHGTADALADVNGAHRLEAGAVNAAVTSHYYDGLFHEVFNEPEHDRVIADLVAWLDSLGPASDRAVASPP